MLADPQSVTINAVANSLPRTAAGVNEGIFTKDDATVKLTVRHAYTGKRTRRVVRLDHRKVAPDPLISANNIIYTMSFYAVVDTPVTGYPVTEAKQLTDALLTWLTTSSGTHMTQVLGGES